MPTEEGRAPVGVQQKLMRHSDIRTTMNVYGYAASAENAAFVPLVALMGGREIRPVSAAGGFLQNSLQERTQGTGGGTHMALDVSLGNRQPNRCPQLNLDRLAILTAVGDLHHSATRDNEA